MKLLESKDTSIKFDTLNYRGQYIEFYENPEISQISAVWNDTKIDLEVNNRSSYIESVKRIVDYQLDTIKEFTVNDSGARLEFFENSGHRDIRLVYKERILKVYLVSKQSELNVEKLVADAIDLITRIYSLL